MPERHSSGDSSPSSSSSSSSSSGKSSWSSSSYHSSNSSSGWSSGGNSSNETPASVYWTVLIIAVVILMIWGGGSLIENAKKNNEKIAKDQQNRAATMTTQAITIADLKEMHTALDKHIPLWKETSDRTVHRVVAEAADFKADSNTKEVDYGYCSETDFYVYVLESSRPGGFVADTEGYAYTPTNNPRSCLPDSWQIVEQDSVGDGWYFVTIRTSTATYAARLTLTPLVTLSPEATDPR
ncbi:MAG: hypothetical protein ABI947_16745 [Chloroflexota bacterium]